MCCVQARNDFSEMIRRQYARLTGYRIYLSDREFPYLMDGTSGSTATLEIPQAELYVKTAMRHNHNKPLKPLPIDMAISYRECDCNLREDTVSAS